ncbi:MAG: ceramidase domain-containing protein [Hyphomicrobiales bacterium]|nr:ceramidase domain-containing protein [Hyphomicrobiales bacterium]
MCVDNSGADAATASGIVSAAHSEMGGEGMGGATIFNYCERASDPSFWAEPLNAITNLGFIVAFVFSLRAARSRPGVHGVWMYFLILTVFAIGVGSFLFHTFATPWAAAADVLPITVFMLAYFAYAVRRFLGANVAVTLIATAGFFMILKTAGDLRCFPDDFGFLQSLPGFQETRCFNGSLGYAPAFLAMAVIGGALAALRHGAAPYVLAAAAVFAVSLTFRTFDREWCEWLTWSGRGLGTHFLWHLLNSLTLFLLLMGAVRHGVRGSALARSGAMADSPAP